ncbi:MAG TPA: CoA transferase [Acidimicrobiales bacterium]|nr:CoA transferase [Acidimicrobiales bacterium]
MNEPLSDWLVVDLSSGIPGGYCSRILADGGAQVIKVEDRAGDDLRRWTASGPLPDGDDGALFRFLAASKRSVVVGPEDTDALEGVLRQAHVVIWSPGSAVAELEALRPAALLRRHPHLTITAITDFGLDGPWAGRPATEFTLQAWSGGIVGLGRGSLGRAPVAVGGRIGYWQAGAHAAVATLLSRSCGPGGQIADVSVLETLSASLTYCPVSYFDALGRPFRKGRAIITPGVGAAKDGMIAVGVGTGQQWLDFAVMVGHPEWHEDKSLFRNRVRLAPVIDEWFAGHTVDEITDLASAFRLPHAPVANGATLPAFEHFRARGTFVRRDGVVQPGPPYRLTPARLRPPGPSPRLGQDSLYEVAGDGADRAAELGRRDGSAGRDPESEGPGADLIAGLRVLDMTAFWAGPSCTFPLALMGADVIHLESTRHLDGTRMLGAPMSEEQWWERSPIFAALNANKRSLTLDIQSEPGRAVLHRLIATTDVIVENYTPRVLEQSGLSFDQLRRIRPDIILVRMPGFGLDGPWRDNAAFAYTIEDASGLTWMTGHPDQKPLEPYCVGDPNAGVHALAGLLLALQHRRRTGEGVMVEAAMVDAAVNVTAEQVIEYSATGRLMERTGNRSLTAAPQNLYRTADVDEYGGDDSWVAISIETDEQWESLLGALGWDPDPRFVHPAGRRDHQDLIDRHLADWCAGRKADEIVELLWPAGVPVAPVVQPHRVGDLAQFEWRRHFETVEHPALGAARYATAPFRLSGRPGPLHTRPAPMLGEHNAEILASLGLSEDEISTLTSEGVIGREPAGR